MHMARHPSRLPSNESYRVGTILCGANVLSRCKIVRVVCNSTTPYEPARNIRYPKSVNSFCVHVVSKVGASIAILRDVAVSRKFTHLPLLGDLREVFVLPARTDHALRHKSYGSHQASATHLPSASRQHFLRVDFFWRRFPGARVRYAAVF